MLTEWVVRYLGPGFVSPVEFACVMVFLMGTSLLFWTLLNYLVAASVERRMCAQAKARQLKIIVQELKK